MRSDAWALACVVYCMCERDDLAHLDRGCRPLRSRRAVGRAAKRPVLELTAGGGGGSAAVYSGYLGRSVAWAGARDPAARPGGWELVRAAARQRDLWLADRDRDRDPDPDPDPDGGAGGVAGVLPWWAAEKRVV